jgi:hypothetical protein
MQEITVNGNGLRDWNVIYIEWAEPKIISPDGKELLL